MDVSGLVEAISHVVVTNVTPFDRNGSVDYGTLVKHAHFLADEGIRVLVPAGNTGEFSSLDADEIRRVIAATIEAVGRRVTVIAGVGGATNTAISLARHAQEAGAHAIMIHHPAHTYIDRTALHRYYERIIESVEIGVVLYKRGPELEDQLLARLVECERVVAVKYATTDVSAFASLVRQSPRPVAWVCGAAERWAPFFHLAGAGGFTSGLANFAPKISLAMYQALRRGSYAEAMSLRQQIVEFEDLRQEHFGAYNVPAVKEGMRLVGFAGWGVREPLSELDAEERAIVRQATESWTLSTLPFGS